MNRPLSLRTAAREVRPGSACFVPGESPEVWLLALQEAGADEDSVRLVLVPRSAGDPRPLGALILGVELSADGAKRMPPGVLPYGQIGESLYLPTEAVLEPPAAPEEIARFAPSGAICVWHPNAGLAVFQDADILSPADLLSPPPETPCDFGRAVPGVAVNRRLLSLTAVREISIESVLSAAREAIGRSSRELDRLPPSPREASLTPWASIKRGLVTRLAKSVLWMTGGGKNAQATTSAESPSGVDDASSGPAERIIAGVFVAIAIFALAFLACWIGIEMMRSPSMVGMFQLLGGVIGAIAAVVFGWMAAASILRWFASRSRPASLDLQDGGRKFVSYLARGVLFALGVATILALVALLLSYLTGRLGSIRPGIELFWYLLFAALVGGLLVSLLVALARVNWPPIGPAANLSSGSPQASGQKGRADQVGGGWLSRLRQWAAQSLSGAAESLSAARHKELERLLHLLDQNPDRGLEYALPLGGDLFRGLAQPGAILGRRNVDFRLGGGSAAAADVWNIQSEYRNRLTQRYRELANRELALGRYRRAAYIFAELLGDWPAAAEALVQGKHFAEAALVFEQRLSRPLDAARCLMEGGQVCEAIVIYERLGQFEIVADLYARLIQPDSAATAFRKAVQQRRERGDRLGAAAILENRLAAPEEAWQEIIGGWPLSAQAEGCLREAFEFAARRQEHDRARSWLNEAARAADIPQSVGRFVACAADLARKYPEALLRVQAEETVLQIASRRLPAASGSELHSLARAIASLAAEDRLLPRDCERFAQSRRRQQTPARPTRGALSLTSSIRLLSANIVSAVAAGDVFYVAGWRNDALVLARCDAAGNVQSPGGGPWPGVSLDGQRPILMALEPYRSQRLIVHPLGQGAVAYRREFAATDGFARAVLADGGLGCNASTIALTTSLGAMHRVDLREGSLVVSTFAGPSLEPALVSTAEFTCPSDLESPRILYQERTGYNLFAVGDKLYWGRHGVLQRAAGFSHPIRQLIASWPHSPFRLILCLSEGGYVISSLRYEEAGIPFANGLVSPAAALHFNRWLIAADAVRCEVYEIGENSLRLHSAIALENLGDMVAVLPGAKRDSFAVCDRSGTIRFFQFRASP